MNDNSTTTPGKNIMNKPPKLFTNHKKKNNNNNQIKALLNTPWDTLWTIV